MLLGPTELLIIQGSPFCNIDCRYCYLPNRSAKGSISIDTIETAVKRLLDDGLIDRKISIVWHAGEPLALPIAFYAEVFHRIKQLMPPDIEVRHNIQTNATLLTQDWCDFIIQAKISIGVSIDGPEEIHDLNRKTRSGKGTFGKVMEGVRLLQKNGIPFHVIAVISRQSLIQGPAICSFFETLGAHTLCFNIEEVEGAHQSSSLQPDTETDRLIRAFYAALYDLHHKSPGHIAVREIGKAQHAILHMPLHHFASNDFGQQLRPFGIVTVDISGNFSTFSPELLGQKNEVYRDFVLGNVHDCAFRASASTAAFKKLYSDIMLGVDLCRKSCQYFSLCGGGAPSNKLFEHGTFHSTETMYCKYGIQAPLEITLHNLEKSLL